MHCSVRTEQARGSGLAPRGSPHPQPLSRCGGGGADGGGERKGAASSAGPSPAGGGGGGGTGCAWGAGWGIKRDPRPRRRRPPSALGGGAGGGGCPAPKRWQGVRVRSEGKKKG